MKTSFKYILLTFAAGVSANAPALAQDAKQVGTGSYTAWGIITVVLFLFAFLLAVILQMANVNKTEKSESFNLKTWWADFNRRVLTKAVAVEKEEDILLDHDYDGIKELDNSLPPWWKYGFYFTIAVGVIYLLRFHVFHAGPTPEEEYKTEMSLASIQVDEYRKKSNDNIDEKSVTLGDAASAERGKKIFTTVCFACHGQKGEGGVGPNLTDNYWLHGGTVNEIFRTIKYGVPDKGMQSWQKTYSPSEIRDLATFITSLKGTNPPNAKAPQGNLATDTPAAAKADSATKK
ncbi:MAG: cbb3-type cytochrome c oxidase N-terminal domain-containing protein [Candidatus Dadabacteria bacterium]